MDSLNIKRINELAHKSKTVGLSEEEKAEQKALRQAYIEAIRNSITSSLDNVSILEPDGSVTKLSKKE